MTARIVARHDQPYLEGASWEINGEYIVIAKEGPGEVLLTLADVRKPAWTTAAYAHLEAVARQRAGFKRIETGIDCHFVVVEPEVASELIAALAAERLGSDDYEGITQADAQRGVLELLDQRGGECSFTEVPDALVEERFPLGYRVRSAIDDLRQAGALQVKPVAKAPPRLVITELGRAILAPPAP